MGAGVGGRRRKRGDWREMSQKRGKTWHWRTFHSVLEETWLGSYQTLSVTFTPTPRPSERPGQQPASLKTSRHLAHQERPCSEQTRYCQLQIFK